MALYALDGDKFLYALDAKPRELYQCVECLCPVKLKQGRQRNPHFYHIKKSPRCRLYGKSETHLLLQLQLQKLLSCEETEMERPFPSIRRIADVFWEKEKIVFEIQCSSISLEEVSARVLDYGKLGYTVVWLMDDRIFNQRFIRPAEAFLRDRFASQFFLG